LTRKINTDNTLDKNNIINDNTTNKMKYAFGFLLFLLGISASAQEIPVNPNNSDGKGLRQGKWTIWFDQKWKPTTIKDSVKYYRLIAYHDSKPLGLVKDYYKSGELQGEFYLAADQPTEVMGDGKSIEYYENGNVQQIEERINGKLVGTMTVYYSNGKMQGEQSYVDGKINGKATTYFENGNKRTEIDLRNDQYHGKFIIYFENGTVKSQRKFANGLLDGTSTWFYEDGTRDVAEYVNGKFVTITIYFKDGTVDQISTLSRRSHLYMVEGEYEKAEICVNQSIQLMLTQQMESDLRYPNLLILLSRLNMRMGNYKEAEPLLVKALQIYKAQLGEENYEYAFALNYLGKLYTLIGNYDKAKPILLRSIQIGSTKGGEATMQFAGLLSGLEDWHMAKNYLKNADSLYQLDIKIREQFGKRRSYVDYLSSLAGYAYLYKTLGNSKKAALLFQEVLSNKLELGENNLYYVKSLVGLASLNQSIGDFESAEQLFLSDNEILTRQIDRQFPSLSEREKLLFYKTFKGNFDSFFSFAIERHLQNPRIADDMYNLQLSTKAILLNSTAKWKQRIRSSGDKKLLGLYSVWEERQTAIASLLNETDPQKRKTIDSIELQANAIEKELSRRSEMFASLADRKKSNWKDVKAKLQPNEVAIEMIRIRKFGVTKIVTDSSEKKLPRYPIHGLTDTVYYAALIITPWSTSPDLVLLKNGNDLENKYIKFYINSIRSQRDDRESYNQFWKPVADRLNKLLKRKSGIRVYFSADGVFNQINLNTLYNPVTKQYVSDEMDVNLVTNTKDLLLPLKEEAFNNLAYLFGYPNYGVSVADRSKLVQKERSAQPLYYAINMERGDNDLSELPGTKTEVETIGTLMTNKGWQPEVLIGDKALEETLKDCFKPRVLHIATHGFFHGHIKDGQNPLLQSGLMLTGAAQTLEGKKDDKTEDGILTAYEAMNLNLDNTDLVVLSACETGLGTISDGEGVYGLQRAFKVAGAKTIIMSLWKVNDETTKELMTSFYENWLNTQNKRQSFNLAQQKVKAKYKSPYYWGAFVMIGD
jgi:CHAT domain-containing protein/antitoxin component YwqK of YwqJK toxin-antitoxin module